MAESQIVPKQILETCIYAEDLAAAERFYSEVMGLPLAGKSAGRHVFFRCGAGMFLIFNPQNTGSELTYVRGSPVPLHGAQGSCHVAFSASEEEMSLWEKHLENHGIAIESDVTWPGGGRSLYFRDPAGNSVELASPSIWGL